MTTLNVYLNFDGNCKEAFEFYRSIFGGEFSYIGKYGDMPEQEGMPALSEADRDKILHVGLPISQETILMGCDLIGSIGGTFSQGNNFSISVNTDSKEEANRIFSALSEGGTITMPMADTFWNAYFGMLRDKFGVNWMLNVNLE